LIVSTLLKSFHQFIRPKLLFIKRAKDSFLPAAEIRAINPTFCVGGNRQEDLSDQPEENQIAYQDNTWQLSH
jgi:hypothetical protein